MARTKATIEKEIKEYKDVIADSSVPKEERDFAKGEVDDLEKELKELESKSGGEEKKEKKSKPAKKAKAKKEKKPKAKTSDKEMSGDECIEKVRQRRASAKASAKKIKTRSVFSALTETITGAGEKALKSIPKEDLKENPKAAVKVATRVGEVIERALKDIKTALSGFLDAADLKLSAEAKRDSESIDKLIADLKKKYADK